MGRLRLHHEVAVSGRAGPSASRVWPRRGAAGVLVLFAVFALAAPVLPTVPARPAKPQPKSPAEKLVGVWRLASVEGDSPMRKVRYDHPTGLILYDRSG